MKDYDFFKLSYVEEIARKNAFLYSAGEDQASVTPFSFQANDIFVPGVSFSSARYYMFDRQYWLNGSPAVNNIFSCLYGYLNFTFVPSVAPVNNYEYNFGLWQVSRTGAITANPLVVRSTVSNPFIVRASYALTGGDTLQYKAEGPLMFTAPYVGIITDATGVITGYTSINFNGYKITYN